MQVGTTIQIGHKSGSNCDDRWARLSLPTPSKGGLKSWGAGPRRNAGLRGRGSVAPIPAWVLVIGYMSGAMQGVDIDKRLLEVNDPAVEQLLEDGQTMFEQLTSPLGQRKAQLNKQGI